jgi:hypothetical protein
VKTKNLEVVKYAARPGEGVPMKITHVVGAPGKTGQLLVNMSDAAVPTRRYSSDVANLIVNDVEVQLLFGQSKIGGGFRSLLVVQFSFDAVDRFAKTLRNYEEWVRALAVSGVSAKKLVEFDEEPSQTVALTANNVMLGYAGREACFDFYFASAFAVHQINTATHLHMEPVVRVTLPTSICLGLIDRLLEVYKTLPKPQEEVSDE